MEEIASKKNPTLLQLKPPYEAIFFSPKNLTFNSLYTNVVTLSFNYVFYLSKK